jgi:hypothetical protein
MEYWQIAVIAVLVLLPMSLMLDFWPHRERLSSRGAPLSRDWQPAPTPPPVDDEHH